jgi:hypothetical protein
MFADSRRVSVNRWGILRLQQSYRNVPHRHSGRCLALKSSMVGVTMYNEVSAMAVYHLRQACGAEEGKDFPRFPVRRFGDRGIMQHSLGSAQLR